MKIENKNYEISMSKASTVAEAMKSLPVFQTVRGSNQWNTEKREQFVNDLAAGKYIPPIAYGYVTDEDGNKSLAIMDGQQRGNAIREAVENGKLSPETEVLVAIDKARDGAELFRVLNIGVPVGSALVTAVSLEGIAGQALLAVAEHKALDLVPWSAIQTGRTERAAFAATLLAVAAGWAMPESSTKACEAWLKEHAAEVDGEGKAEALAMADRIAAALVPYAETVSGEDKKRAKVARRVLGGIRKKNNWLTLCQLVKDDYSAEDAVALFADGEVWTKGGRYYPTAVQGGKRLKTASTIPMGGGSSGNAVDTAKRLDAAIYYLAEGGEFVRDPYAMIDADTDAKTDRKAAEKAAGIAPDAPRGGARDVTEGGTMATTATAARGLLPPLTVEEQQKLAAALVRDAMQMFRGKAGSTLAITDASGDCITARSKPLEVVAFRMRQYNACPALFRFFLSRHEGELFDKLRAYYAVTFPECAEV